MIKFGDFRSAEETETLAAYFRNAVSKAAIKAGVSCESTVQSFVSAAIEWAENDPFSLNKAYEYAVKQMEMENLHLSIQDIIVNA
jgi:hypothetical protein